MQTHSKPTIKQLNPAQELLVDIVKYAFYAGRHTSTTSPMQECEDTFQFQMMMEFLGSIKEQIEDTS